MSETPASPNSGETPKPKKQPSAKQIAAREAFAQRGRDFKAWQEAQRTGSKPPPVTAKATPPPAQPSSAPPSSAPGGGSPSSAPAVPEKMGFGSFFAHATFPGLFTKKGG